MEYVQCTWEWRCVHARVYTDAPVFLVMPHGATQVGILPRDLQVSELSFLQPVGKSEPVLLQHSGLATNHCACFLMLTPPPVYPPRLHMFTEQLLCTRLWEKLCPCSQISKASGHRLSKHRNKCKIVTPLRNHVRDVRRVGTGLLPWGSGNQAELWRLCTIWLGKEV